MSHGKTLTKKHQAETRRCQWGSVAGASRRFKQSGLYQPVRTGNKAALRRCYAIQPQQQRGAIGLMALHEREARLDFICSAQQSHSRTQRPLLAGANTSGNAPQQGKLVRPDLVRTRQHYRAGNIGTGMAERLLCSLAAAGKGNPQKEAATTGNEASVLPEQEKTLLSDHRINRPPYISVHRIRELLCLSVQRIYGGHFMGFSLSVHRTPSSNTTPLCVFRKGI